MNTAEKIDILNKQKKGSKLITKAQLMEAKYLV
jgi:hypothetical protein